VKRPSKLYKPNGEQETTRRRRQGLMTEPGSWRIIRVVDYLYKELTNGNSQPPTEPRQD
jgi:hypothetical protein